MGNTAKIRHRRRRRRERSRYTHGMMLSLRDLLQAQGYQTIGFAPAKEKALDPPHKVPSPFRKEASHG